MKKKTQVQPVQAEEPQLKRSAGRYDRNEPRQSKRGLREKGCWVYLPAEELIRAGLSVFDEPPRYLTEGRRAVRGGVLRRHVTVRLLGPKEKP